MLTAPTLSRRAIRRVVCLGCLCLLAMSGCTLGQTQSAMPTAPAQHPGLPLGSLDPAPPPSGWQRLLNGVRFTGTIGESGLVTTPAHPGRLAGCALPAGKIALAIPVFVLSDDAGQTWQVRAINGAQPTATCTVLADTQQDDAFVLVAGTQSWSTTDGGQTWRLIAAPNYQALSLGKPPSGFYVAQDPRYGSGPTLVGGHLVTSFYTTQTTPVLGFTYSVVEATLSSSADASWQVVSTGPLGITDSGTHSLETVALDPQDPNRLYATVSTGASGVRLYETGDGGQSWHVAREWPTAERVALWTAQHDQIYVQDLADLQAQTAQFFYSPDGGATWRGIGLHDRSGGGESISVSPTGRVVTAFGTPIGANPISPNLFSLDPATGDFSLLTSLDSLTGMVLGVVVDGASPQFIYASQSDTYVLSLPRQ